MPGAKNAEPNPFAELTAQETKVMTLVATGPSNSEIAERTVISESTVKGHVSDILSKLHLSDRPQAAIYAWREGIVRRA